METRALRERLQDYIDAGIIGVYDLTSYSREQHDLEAEFDSKGKRIKMSKSDRWLYNKKQLAYHEDSRYRRIKENEEIVNPWK